jgi:hypothetical protein
MVVCLVCMIRDAVRAAEHVSYVFESTDPLIDRVAVS